MSSLRCLLLPFLLLTLSVTVEVSGQYTITAIQRPDGAMFAATPFDVNDSGQVTGVVGLAANSPDAHAFLWDAGQLTVLETLGGPNSRGVSINNSGQIVGFGDTTEMFGFVSASAPALFTNGTVQNLANFNSGSGAANDINDSGVVVGVSTTTASPERQLPFAYTGGVFSSLSPALPETAFALSVSETGVIFGTLTRNGRERPFFLEDGVLVEIAPPTASIFSLNAAANNNGDFFYSAIDFSANFVQLLYLDQQFIDPQPILNGIRDFDSITITAINDDQTIVGSVGNGILDPDSSAFVIENGVGFDLGSLLSPADQANWSLNIAEGLSEAGHIVGRGMLNGVETGFILTPFILGDVNGDGDVNFLDIPPFVAVLTSDDFLDQADIDRNGVVNFLDIAPFILLLIG